MMVVGTYPRSVQVGERMESSDSDALTGVRAMIRNV